MPKTLIKSLQLSKVAPLIWLLLIFKKKIGIELAGRKSPQAVAMYKQLRTLIWVFRGGPFSFFLFSPKNRHLIAAHFHVIVFDGRVRSSS